MASQSHIIPEPFSGRFDGPVHRFAVRVYFEDTDLTGMVYHANYLRWFERARSDMLQLLGIDQRRAQESGEGAYAVTELAIRYLAPARLGDAVVLESGVEEMRAASGRIWQSALCGETLLAQARVRVGFLGSDGRPRRQPDAWRQAFAPIVNPCEG